MKPTMTDHGEFVFDKQIMVRHMLKPNPDSWRSVLGSSVRILISFASKLSMKGFWFFMNFHLVSQALMKSNPKLMMSAWMMKIIAKQMVSRFIICLAMAVPGLLFS